jgi:hypothetical protein
VRNLNTERAIFVSWDKTGLSSFIEPKQEIYSYFEYSDNSHEEHSVPLWYGARPDKVNAPTVFYKPLATSTKAQSSLLTPTNGRSSTILPAQYPREVAAPQGLESKGVVAIPDLYEVEALSGKILSSKEIITFTEAHPSVLVRLEMTFTSTPVIDPKSGTVTEIENACTYKLISSRRSAEARIKIKDNTLHHSIFDREGPIRVSSYYSDGRPLEFQGNSPVSNLKAVALRKKTTEILVVGPDGKSVLASIPIAYLGE